MPPDPGKAGKPVRNRIPLPFLLFCVALSSSGAIPRQAPQPTQHADRIVIIKSTHTMSLMVRGQIIKTYKVALSPYSVGPKERYGDHKTPEGIYSVDWKNPKSQFHLALHVSYPNAADRERARKLGVNPGGEIEIHGLGAKYGWVGARHRETDWTEGCIAVTNEEIEEIWKLVPVGTPIEILP